MTKIHQKIDLQNSPTNQHLYIKLNRKLKSNISTDTGI